MRLLDILANVPLKENIKLTPMNKPYSYYLINFIYILGINSAKRELDMAGLLMVLMDRHG